MRRYFLLGLRILLMWRTIVCLDFYDLFSAIWSLLFQDAPKVAWHAWSVTLREPDASIRSSCTAFRDRGNSHIYIIFAPGRMPL